MNEEKLKQIFAKNLAFYRKQVGLTQSQLADKLNYSDKSVSKWERGESLPDLFISKQLCELFDISIDDMLVETPCKPKTNSRRKNIIVPLLSFGLAWLVAVLAFFVLSIVLPDFEGNWLVFVYCVPLSCIVLIVFSSIARKKWLVCLFVSLLTWGLATAIFVTVKIQTFWLVFVIAGVFQVLTVLFFMLNIYSPKNK